MKKLLSTLSSTLQGGVRGGLLFLALVATTSLWAHDFEVDGIYYNYLDGNNVEVTYRGNYSNSYNNEYSGAVIIPETVTYNGTTYRVTSIGKGTFLSCSSLTSVTIGNRVTSIGSAAFSRCSSLTFITIPNSVTSIGVYAFEDCTSLTSVTIGNSVTSIGDNAFWGCISLASITIPNSVTSIGDDAFYGCSSLASITIPNSVTSIGSWAFYSCSSLTSITIPNSVTTIERDAFADCSSLTSVTIGNSVTNIGIRVFEDCSSLTSIVVETGNTTYDSRDNCNAIIETATNTLIAGCQNTVIPNSVTSIGDNAFYSCPSLTFITIPNSVTSIGSWAFYGCTSLTSVIIPNSVTNIGIRVFEDCSSLTSIVVERGNTEYDSRDNCNAIIETATNTLIAGCQNTVIPNSVTSIGRWAFYGCTSLTSVIIPNSVTSIGDNAFWDCSSLTSIVVERGNTEYDSRDNCNAIIETATNTLIAGCQNTVIPNSVTSIGSGAFCGRSSLTSINIPNSVTSIESSTFFGCSSLTSVTIPNSVTSIGEHAFYYCSSLDTLTCLAMTPPALGEGVFYGCDNPTLYVPCEALPDYQAHEQWGQFTTIECIASEEAETEEVVVESGTTTVIITWPTEEGADTYTIVIKKDGEVVCTLTFNAEGQLINIAFAPGRDGNHPAQYAEAVANGKGFRFTVTGLEDGTDYTYTVTSKDAANKTISEHSGEFTTNSATALDNTHSQSPITNCQKILRNGQLIILRDGVEYNAMGQEL